MIDIPLIVFGFLAGWVLMDLHRAWRSRRDAKTSGDRSLVVVHQHNGPTLEGVLVHRSQDHYRIAMPKLIEAEDRTMPLDGEVEIPRERVLFLQLLAREA